MLKMKSELLKQTLWAWYQYHY